MNDRTNGVKPYESTMAVEFFPAGPSVRMG